MRLQRDNEAAASMEVWISIGTKLLWSLVRGGIHWVASAALRILPRYLPWLRCDALHPSAPDATRVARLNQCFLKKGDPVKCASFDRSRRNAVKAAAAVGAASFGFPAVIVRAQSETISIGHLTPRGGLLGQVGQYGYRGATLAVEEVNAAGGVLGRRLELRAEDSVNPSTALSKAQKLVERDKVIALIGEVSSASAVTIAEQALKLKTPYFNTGANADALRGQNCNRFVFHIEGSNTMYAKALGTWQKDHNLLKGARWYFVTADYPFGQDMYRVCSRFLQENGGVVLANDMVTSNTADYSPYILKIRSLKPDFVYLNLTGSDQTTFLKQYREYNVPFPLGGGVMEIVPFWAAGLDHLAGHWQTLWYHGCHVPSAQSFSKRFTEKFQGPPDNQAWSDYVGIKILAQSIAETRS